MCAEAEADMPPSAEELLWVLGAFSAEESFVCVDMPLSAGEPPCVVEDRRRSHFQRARRHIQSGIGPRHHDG